MRLALALIPLLALAPPALADKKGDNDKQAGAGLSGPAGGTPGVDPTRRFVESNVIETLYHELAHALIDIMALPVLGPEEFAADLFSFVLMDRLHGEEDAIRLAYDVAFAYDADRDMEESLGRRPAMWDVHGSNQQRYYNLVCMFYGANPEERGYLANDLGLPEARADSCPSEYALASRSWGQVLERLEAGAPGDTISIDWVLDGESHLTRFVSSEVDRLNRLFALPEHLTVSVIPCDEVNAFYDPGKREIIICTELGEHLEELAP